MILYSHMGLLFVDRSKDVSAAGLGLALVVWCVVSGWVRVLLVLGVSGLGNDQYTHGDLQTNENMVG